MSVHLFFSPKLQVAEVSIPVPKVPCLWRAECGGQCRAWGSVLPEVHGSGMQGFFLEQNQIIVLRGKKKCVWTPIRQMSASRRLLKTVFHCNTTELIRAPLACVQTEAWVSVPSFPLCWGEFQQRGSKSPSSVALPGRKAGSGEERRAKGQKGRLAQPLHLTC